MIRSLHRDDVVFEKIVGNLNKGSGDVGGRLFNHSVNSVIRLT